MFPLIDDDLGWPGDSSPDDSVISTDCLQIEKNRWCRQKVSFNWQVQYVSCDIKMSKVLYGAKQTALCLLTWLDLMSWIDPIRKLLHQLTVNCRVLLWRAYYRPRGTIITWLIMCQAEMTGRWGMRIVLTHGDESRCYYQKSCMTQLHTMRIRKSSLNHRGSFAEVNYLAQSPLFAVVYPIHKTCAFSTWESQRLRCPFVFFVPFRQ